MKEDTGYFRSLDSIKEYLTSTSKQSGSCDGEEGYYAKAISHLDSLDVNFYSDDKRVQELDDLVQITDEISNAVANKLIEATRAQYCSKVSLQISESLRQRDIAEQFWHSENF